MVAAVVAAGCLICAATALATVSSLTINSKQPNGPNGRFNGTLSSTDKSCVQGFKVKLHRDAPGKPRHYRVAGVETSDRHGKWAVHFGGRIPKGSYYASQKGTTACPAVRTTVVTIK